MSGIDLTFSEEEKKLPIGASKFLGNPDVWIAVDSGESFEWPQFTEDGESYDLTFICQINCAQAAPYDKDGVLPKTGMLYFFYDMDEMPVESFGMGVERILYFDGEPSSLCQMLRTDHEGNDMSLREMKIHYHHGRVDSSLLRARLGEIVPQGWQPFFQLFSFETDKVSIKFTDKSALIFFIDKPKLERGDFSNIHVKQITNRPGEICERVR